MIRAAVVLLCVALTMALTIPVSRLAVWVILAVVAIAAALAILAPPPAVDTRPPHRPTLRSRRRTTGGARPAGQRVSERSVELHRRIPAQRRDELLTHEHADQAPPGPHIVVDDNGPRFGGHGPYDADELRAIRARHPAETLRRDIRA